MKIGVLLIWVSGYLISFLFANHTIHDSAVMIGWSVTLMISVAFLIVGCRRIKKAHE